MSNENQKRFGLLDRSVEVEPIGVIYNVMSEDIETFLFNYFKDVRKIDGVAAIRISVVRDGTSRPEVKVYAMFHMNSVDVVSNLQNVPEPLRRKMDSGNYRVSDKLKNALYAVAKEFKIGTHTGERIVYSECNIFKILGLMFAVDNRAHSISIPEVVKLKKNKSILTVIKTNKFFSKDDDGTDKYSSIVNNLDN